MKCEKCQDRGFTEENYGLTVICCDCEAGKEYRARMVETLGIPGEIDDSSVAGWANAHANALIMPKLEGETRNIDMANNPQLYGIDSHIPPEAVESINLPKELTHDSSSGTGQDNQPLRSADTGQPKQPKKPKAKRKARARTS